MRRALILAAVVLAGCPKKDPEPAVPEAPPTEPAPTEPALTDPAATDTPPEAPSEAPKEPEKAPAAATSGGLTADERAVNDAVDLLAKGDPASRARAISTLEGLVKKDPDLAWAWFNLGVAEYQDGDPTKAREHFATSVAKDPTFGPGYLYVGVIDQETKGTDAAMSTWRTGISKAPEYMDLRVAVIGALRDQGKLDAAVDEAKAALKVNSNSLPVYNNLGLIYMEREQLDLAMFVYQKALASVPAAEKDVYIRANLGRIYFLRGEKSAALFHLLEAVKIDPYFVPGLIYLAQIYQDDRNYGDMLPLLEAAAKGSPENHGVQMNLGIAYRGVGRYDDAKKAWEKALQLNASDPEPYFNLGILYGDYLRAPDGAKMYDQAIESFNTYISSGGKQKDLAKTYIEAVEKDKKKYLKKKEKEAAEIKRKADEEAKKKAEEEAKRNAPPPPAPEPAPPPDEPPPEGGTP